MADYNRTQSYNELSTINDMVIITEINNQWDKKKPINPGELPFIRINQNSLTSFKSLYVINIFEHEMYIAIDPTNSIKIYYPNFYLFLVSTDNYAGITNGTVFGCVIPTYNTIQSKSDYFNYIILNGVPKVPYEFYEVLHELYSKI